MHAAHYSSLLPDIFRHRTTRVRVLKPKAVLLDFHGTITERRWEDKVIYPYVKRALNSYLRNNLQLDSVQRCIPGLKNESFEQRFRHKYDDAPIINDQVGSEEVDLNELADQMAEFLLWQMNNKRETKETQIIERLVWQDGFRRDQVLTPLYDDVLPCVRLWHEKYVCSVHIISSIEEETLKLLLSHTTHGNLDCYVASYVTTRKFGDKMISAFYKEFFENLGKSSPPHGLTKQVRFADQTPAVLAKDAKSPNAEQPTSTGSSSNRRSHASVDISERPILFLTDSGQEAKAASQVNEGQAYECLLVNRLGNKRIRPYYLGHFQYIENFNDITFVS